MKSILYDQQMPFAERFFSTLGEAKPFQAGKLKPSDLKGVDAIALRSTTRVDADLLRHAEALSWIGTATAGFNHLDLAYLKQKNIQAYWAAGCNAVSVSEYVLVAVSHILENLGQAFSDLTVAVVGVGEVGRRVSHLMQAMGCRVLEYDPPRAELENDFVSASFDEVLRSDLITVHTPLVTQGAHPSFHLFDEQALLSLSSQQILLNAGRGEVVDNTSLLRLKQKGEGPRVILDVWEYEPNVLSELVPFVDIATPHIAGHSVQGKLRGTVMTYQALCAHWGLTPALTLEEVMPSPDNTRVKMLQNVDVKALNVLLKGIYDIRQDDRRFRLTGLTSKGFAELRQNYPQRFEFSSYFVDVSQASDWLLSLGFSEQK